MRALPASLLLAAVLLPGCGVARPAGWSETRARLAAARYPEPAAADAERGAPLRVDVVRDGGSLYLINREPRRLDGARLWLNQQWAGDLERVPIGPGAWIPLDRFINRHGEPFPRGRFLRPDLAKPLILAELVPAGSATLRPLTVIPED
ncbi:hypothetical protein [Phycisphaera mikurensis]|uniref:YkuD domain-containing protein n=1 Tax=Phycisphaera mikurensis (strain NBRC 102666 / KCTC 22515 / FYK2301M01) TaxID=1142394 RepID=I0II19_PHYMF|nr:hypothetical protein [Phycisphaera mikurensis]MBB6442529.1 hypothetical protein [Phycisphaera mikurensis]BAM04907.1 hypothetical protein PSMK_27480 [Phycisphaera mikurensis NBRC 102666]